MAGSVNKVILIGNVGAEPEIRSTSIGKEIANLRLATSESWKDKATGERRDKTEWHTVVVFNDGLVNVVKNYVRKGSKLFIEGALQTRKWQDKDGNDRYTTEIVLQGYGSTLTMLDSRGGAGGADAPAASYGQEANAGGGFGQTTGMFNSGAPAVAGVGAGASNVVAEEIDDDIPF